MTSSSSSPRQTSSRKRKSTANLVPKSTRGVATSARKSTRGIATPVRKRVRISSPRQLPRSATKATASPRTPKQQLQEKSDLLCCAEIKYDPSHAFNVSDTHHALIKSLVSELKHMVQPTVSTSPSVPQSPPYTPLSFKYCIEVTTRVPAPDGLPLPNPILAPAKPWRWFVLMDEEAFFEELEEQEEQEEQEELYTTKQLKDGEMGHIDRNEDAAKVLLGLKRPIVFDFGYGGKRTGLTFDTDLYDADFHAFSPSLKRRKLDVSGRRVEIRPEVKKKWSEISYQDLPNGFDETKRKPYMGVKMICGERGHKGMWSFQVLQKVSHAKKQVTQSGRVVKKPRMGLPQRTKDSDDDGDDDDEEDVEMKDVEDGGGDEDWVAWREPQKRNRKIRGFDSSEDEWMP